MTPDALRRHLIRLDISQLALGRMLAVDSRTARRWASGHQPIPTPVATLIETISVDDARRMLRVAENTRYERGDR